MSIEEKIDKLVTDVTEIKIALKGYDGQSGVCERLDMLEKSFYKFRNTAILILGLLIGSGLLGTGIYELVRNIL